MASVSSKFGDLFPDCEYEKQRELSSDSSYGDVFSVVEKRDPTKKHALKLFRDSFVSIFENLLEIDIMFRLQSPFILKGRGIGRRYIT
jgi:hypothetical protein